MECTLCPRSCGIDRKLRTGFCGQREEMRCARVALHFGEEPCISGVRGSGTVFFSGCTLRCVFCQNYDISSGPVGWAITPEALASRLIDLQNAGAHNLNFVTPTQFLPGVEKAVSSAGSSLSLPRFANCGGYERIETLVRYADLFQGYMPDLKFCDSDLSSRYLHATDYFAVATRAICQMRVQAGPPVFDKDGMLRSGVLIRHLVMPGCVKDSLRIIRWLGTTFGPEDVVVSLMSQYLPMGRAADFPEIDRRLTSYEYEKAEDALREYDFKTCYVQSRGSATRSFVPLWNGEGVIQ